MDGFSEILYIGSECLLYLFLVIFLKLFYNVSKKTSMKLCGLGFSTIVILTVMLNNYLEFDLLSSFNTLAQIVLVMIVIREKFFGKLLIVILAEIILLSMEAFLIFLMNFLPSDLSFYNRLFVSFLCLIMILLIYYSKKVNIKDVPNYILWNLLIGICAGVFPMLAMLFFKEDISSPMYYTIIGISLLTMMASILANYHFYAVKKENERMLEESRVSESLLQVQTAYADTLLEKYDSMRSFQHDIKSYFIVIEDLLKRKEYDELQTFIEDARRTQQQNTLFFCDNVYISALVQKFSEEAKGQNIKWEFHYDVKQSIQLNKFEICSLFYNLFSNAIEAADKALGNRVINIRLSVEQAVLHIEIENSVSEDFKMEDIILHKSTKTDVKKHGVGLYNIQHIVNTYHGDIRYRQENDILHTSILIMHCLK